MTFARQSLGSLVALVVGIAASVLLARVLGAQERGEYQLAVRTAGLVLAFAQFGIQEVLLQLVADQRQRTGALVGTSLILGLIGAIAAAAVLAVATPFLQQSLLAGVGLPLVLLALGGSLAAIVSLLGRRFIQLNGHVGLYNALDLGRTILFLALVAALALLLPRQALGAVNAWLVGEAALAIATLYFLWRRVSTHWTVDWRLARTLVVAGAPIQVGLIATYVGNEGGAYVLNAQLGLAAVGVYGVALSVARLVLQVSMALRTALQPRLVGAETDSAAMTARVTRHGLLWMLALSLGLLLLAPFVPTIFGSDFAAAPLVLALMLPGMVAYGVMQLVTSHLLRVGQRSILALSSWILALASLALQALGAQFAGLPGAALGLSLAYALSLSIVLTAFTRHTHRPLTTLLPGLTELSYYLTLAPGLRMRRSARNEVIGGQTESAIDVGGPGGSEAPPRGNNSSPPFSRERRGVGGDESE